MTTPTAAERAATLLRELEAARDGFCAAVADADPSLVDAPGVVGAWSVRDLVVHVGFWSAHGAEALELAADGHGAAFDDDPSQTDAINASVTDGARSLSFADARDREERAFARFRAALAALDPGLLDAALGNGDRVEAVVRCDGPGHYAEHTAHLRAWWAAPE